jgi:RNA polymerase sigma factor (sigma-70 family)
MHTIMRRAAMGEAERDESSRKLITNPTSSKDRSPITTETDVVGAFSAFYRESLGALVAFLMYQGATLVDASDLAQEAMAAAFRSWSVIEYPKAWTRRVASRAYIRLVSRTEVLSEEMPELGVLISEDGVIELEEKHEVLRLMLLLPPRQRQVLAWTFDGFTPAEIATELKLEPEAVRASLLKARRAIAAHLTAREEDMR